MSVDTNIFAWFLVKNFKMSELLFKSKNKSDITISVDKYEITVPQYDNAGTNIIERIMFNNTTIE